MATVSGLLTGLGASAAYAYNRSAKVEIGDVGLELDQSEQPDTTLIDQISLPDETEATDLIQA